MYVSHALNVSYESLSVCSEISVLLTTERAKLEERSELKAESRRLIALNTCHFEITL